MSSPRSFLRMPLGYGPMPGPRQTSTGQSLLKWDEVHVNTSTITFKAPKDQISSFLPHSCFHIADSSVDEEGLALASIMFVELKNLPWLAGRGYNHCGLYIHNVICEGSEETVTGKYLSVLFENRADPIISGREELGYAKVYASLDEEQTSRGKVLTIGWEGNVFGQMIFEDLAEMDETGDRSPTAMPLTGPQGVLHYKYIPKTGFPGFSDVEYPTYSPPADSSTSTLLKTFSAAKPSLSFKALGFQQLPTLHHVAEKLAMLKITEITDARITVSKGSSDLRNQRAIAFKH